MDQRILRTAFVVFVITVIGSVLRGGMWLDEMQVWCLARDSRTLADLFVAIRNEGHPPLWPMLVWSVTRLTHEPMAMAALHGVFALGTAWLVFYRTTWPLHWRVLFLFGYFMVFEYTAVARNYGPGVFFLFAAFFAWHKNRTWIATALLIALAMTHFWGIVVSGAWAVATLVNDPRTPSTQRATVVVLVGALSALLLAVPSADLPYTPRVDRLSGSDLLPSVARMVGQVLLPFPDLRVDRPWNTSWLISTWPGVNDMLGPLLLGLMCWSLSGDRRMLFFHALVVIGILAFPLLAPFKSIRYIGPLFIAFMAAHTLHRGPLSRAKSIVVTVILALQIPAALAMYRVHLRMPRSTAELTARWVNTSAHAELPVVAHPYQTVPALSGYLKEPVWCPATGAWESVCRWTHQPFRLEHGDLIRALQGSPFPTALYISDDADLANKDLGTLDLTLLHSSGRALIQSEELHVYLLQRRPSL